MSDKYVWRPFAFVFPGDWSAERALRFILMQAYFQIRFGNRDQGVQVFVQVALAMRKMGFI